MAGTDFGSFGMGLSIAGMFMSAVGAHDAAASQKLAISAQAQLDQLNARSTAMAMNGQADLDLMNQKAGFEAMGFNSAMNLLGTKAQIFDAKSGAQLNMLNAETSAGMTLLSANTRAALADIQAGMQTQSLEVGAHIADQNASLLDLQADSTMLHGEWREQDSRMQYAQAKSRATVQMARGNLDLSEGTPLAQRVGIDLMSERAAIMIQQDTLMQAFGQRTAASNARLDAGLKRAQAQTITSMTSIQNASDLGMADLAASSALRQATLKTALTDIDSQFQMQMSLSAGEWTQAMMQAGMLEANAAAVYKHTMATVLEQNASAAASVKQAMAAGISPTTSVISSILGSAGQVAGSWYNFNKVNG